MEQKELSSIRAKGIVILTLSAVEGEESPHFSRYFSRAATVYTIAKNAILFIAAR